MVTVAVPFAKIEFQIKLINEIKNRPCLYSEEINKGRVHNSIKSIAWNEIHCKLGQSGFEVCKRNWNNLKRNYRNHRLNAQNNKCEDITWVHYETINSFLEVQKIMPKDKENDRENVSQKNIEKGLSCQEYVQDVYNKCGEIMISNNKQFKFICFICHEEHHAIKEFSSHILKIHLKSNKNLEEFQNQISVQSTEEYREYPNYGIAIKAKKINECDAKEIHLNDKTNKQVAKKTDNDIMLHDILENNKEFISDKQPDISSEENLLNISNGSKTNSTDKTTRELHELSDNCMVKKPQKNRNSKRGVFPCDQCKRIFAYKSQVSRHKRLHTDYRPYKCEICEQSFKLNHLLKNHLSVCHSEERPFPCRNKDCSKKFKTAKIRKLHEILHTNVLPFQCQDCGKCFPQNSYLITHRKAWHVDKSNYRHKCQFCEKTFHSKQNLKFHTYTHTGERPYGCSICPTRFTKPGSVKEHMKIHSGERNYICQICNAAFNQIAGLIQHKKRHEEIVE